MPARKQPKNGRPWTPERVRERIRIGLITKRLEDHVFGEVELSQTQVSSAGILLKKCLPDLAQTTVANPDGSNLNFMLMVPPKNG